MSKFTSETMERIRDGVDIVEVVSAYTDLRRQGERFVGLCPFHEERTPSFSVKPRDGFYYCFGCEAGGDAIRFVQEKEGLSFPDAVEALAERYGIEVERETEDPRAEEARRRRGRLGELLERVAAFYEHYLWDSPQAKGAREYLRGRGLNEETLRDFGVGFAPSPWDSVLLRGQKAGFTVDELRAAGLVQKGQKGGFYDAFRARITFPVRDVRGRAVGFGARAMGADAKPKYKNSAEGELYRKSRTLYGIDRARGPIARSGRAVVVEGYTDVLALHQAGNETAVAVMGTAITPEQLKLLGGYAEEVVLALDADRAGREAMLRAQRVAGSDKLRLLVAAMPEGEDPADMLAAEGGAERLGRLIDEAVDLPVFHVRAILADADLGTPAGRDRALDEALAVLAAMGETITRQELIREVADRLDTDPDLVVHRLERSRRVPAQRRAPEPRPSPTPSEAQAPRRAPAPPRESGPQGRSEEALLAMCIASPALGEQFLDRLTAEHFATEANRRALEWLRDHLEDPLEGVPREDEALLAQINRLAQLSEPASEAAMTMNWRQLEVRRIERAMREAEGDELIRLQRDRANMAEAIARGAPVSR